jgi:hypothetical protein
MEYAVADVRDERRGSDGEEFEAQWRYAVEEAFPGAEGNRCDVSTQFIDEAAGEVLVDCGGSTGNGDVAITGSDARPCQSGIDAVGDKCERRTTLHRQRVTSDGG